MSDNLHCAVGTEAVEQILLNMHSDSIVFLKQLGQRSMTDYRKITKSNTSGTKSNTSGKKGSTQASLHDVLFLSSSSSSSINTSPTVKPLQSEPAVAAENKSDGNSSSSIIYSDLNFESMLSDIRSVYEIMLGSLIGTNATKRRENQSKEAEIIEQSQPSDDFDLTSDDLRELTAPILPQSDSAKLDISRKRKDTNDEVEFDRMGAKKRACTTFKIGDGDLDVIRDVSPATPSKIAQSRKEPMTTTSPARLNRKEPVFRSTYTEQHPPSSSTFSTSLAAPSTSPSADSTSRRLTTDSSSIMDISSTYDADAFFKMMENLRTERPQKVDACASASSRNNASSTYATATTLDTPQQPTQLDKTSNTQRQNDLRTPVKFAKLTDFLQEYVDIVDP
ncbi:hypothetical protein BZA70DRAFT_283130 [Myxozyma melibiosi]|uniref:Uncharacterized protein n=1 Tax=Myxozyma melibiosi TaxID=54550 RepID=A0ABR1F1J1_9ASCO